MRKMCKAVIIPSYQVSFNAGDILLPLLFTPHFPHLFAILQLPHLTQNPIFAFNSFICEPISQQEYRLHLCSTLLTSSKTYLLHTFIHTREEHTKWCAVWAFSIIYQPQFTNCLGIDLLTRWMATTQFASEKYSMLNILCWTASDVGKTLIILAHNEAAGKTKYFLKWLSKICL